MTATASAPPSTPAEPPRPALVLAPPRTDLFDVVVDAVVLVLEVPRDSVSVGTDLVADLEADSLALVEIVEVVESRLLPSARPGFAVADGDIEDLVTVGAFVDYLKSRV